MFLASNLIDASFSMSWNATFRLVVRCVYIRDIIAYDFLLNIRSAQGILKVAYRSRKYIQNHIPPIICISFHLIMSRFVKPYVHCKK